MKLLNRYTTGPLALLASLAIRLWISSLELRFVGWTADRIPGGRGRKFVYVLWHENVILGVGLPWRKYITPLIGTHRDGELINRAFQLLGGSASRGSSTRGGSKAMRNMMQTAKTSIPVITPDGPKGPRQKAQSGAIYLASRAGVPIIAIGIACRHASRVGSWDRMVLPWFFTKVFVCGSQKLEIPADLPRNEVDSYLPQLQAALDQAQATADGLASGSIPSPANNLSLDQAKAMILVND